MSQSEYPEEKDNPNNMLWMSWPTHQRFDGLNTVDQHRVPQIAISYIAASHTAELFEGGFERYKVEIAVECADDDIFAVMQNRIKPGMKTLEEQKKILTFVHVVDPSDFERCLTNKYNETKIIWTKKSYGTAVTKEEAHTLRRSARIQELTKESKIV
jgi:hypothetical protein